MFSFEEIYAIENCLFDHVLGLLIADDRIVQLNYSEAKILHLLLASPDGAASRDAISAALNFRVIVPNSRAVDVHVSSLRAHLKTVGLGRRLRAVRCFGYQFEGHSRKIQRIAPSALSSRASSKQLDPVDRHRLIRQCEPVRRLA